MISDSFSLKQNWIIAVINSDIIKKQYLKSKDCYGK